MRNAGGGTQKAERGAETGAGSRKTRGDNGRVVMPKATLVWGQQRAGGGMEGPGELEVIVWRAGDEDPADKWWTMEAMQTESVNLELMEGRERHAGPGRGAEEGSGGDGERAMQTRRA